MENPGAGKGGGDNTHLGWMLCGKSRCWEEGVGGGGVTRT